MHRGLVTVSLRAALFDVDGVLVDSLPQHLQICRDKAKEFGLEISVPTVDQFRSMVAAGKKVSPMSEFFRAVGFPERYIERAVADYEREFTERYKPLKFSGVDQMLSTLHAVGLQLGIATSNTRSNVEPVLGDAMRYFYAPLVFFLEHDAASRSKSASLTEAVRRLGVDPSACVYIGDQPADSVAAGSTGLRFLGVTYGWGISPGESKLDTVDTVPQIAQRIIELSGAADGVKGLTAAKVRPSV